MVAERSGEAPQRQELARKAHWNQQVKLLPPSVCLVTSRQLVKGKYRRVYVDLHRVGKLTRRSEAINQHWHR